jgi:hypothetical protein
VSKLLLIHSQTGGTQPIECTTSEIEAYNPTPSAKTGLLRCLGQLRPGSAAVGSQMALQSQYFSVYQALNSLAIRYV